MGKKTYALVGCGSRARFFYEAVAATYEETSEMVAFCDLSPTRMDYANKQLESLGPILGSINILTYLFLLKVAPDQ